MVWHHPPGNNGLTFVLKVSSFWNLWRCPTQLPWEAWHPPAVRNHEMPKHNQPSQLHAGSKLCSIFGIVFHLFLHHYFRIFYCISLKPRTTYCNLKPYVIVCHCSFHPCRLLAIQMILGQLSAAWCPANPLMTFSSSAQSCLDFAKALNTTSKGSNSRMQVETCWNCRSWTFSKSFEVFKCHWSVKHVNQPNMSMVLLGQAVKCPTSPTPKGQASKWYAMAKVSMAWLPSYGEMIQDATVCQCIFCSVCPGPEATSAHIFLDMLLDMIYKYICTWSYIYIIYTYIYIYMCVIIYAFICILPASLLGRRDFPSIGYKYQTVE